MKVEGSNAEGIEKLNLCYTVIFVWGEEFLVHNWQQADK